MISRPGTGVGPNPVGGGTLEPVTGSPEPSLLSELKHGLTRAFQYHAPINRIIDFTHLNHDALGAGLLPMRADGAPQSNPAYENRKEGLHISLDRPAGSAAAGSLGHMLVVDKSFPINRFLVIATFRRPQRVQLPGYVEGNYAAAVLVRVGSLPTMGASCQVRPNGIRLNLPGTEVNPNLNPIAIPLQNQITDASFPAQFSLALKYDRDAAPGGSGYAALLIGDDVVAAAHAFAFTKLSGFVSIEDVRAGIGTAGGENFRVSVELIDIQIWLP